MALQIISSINIGISKREQDEEVDAIGDEEDELDDKDKFENKYLDPKSMKEKKKVNRDASRMMKLTLTDGVNTFEAMEYEKLRHMEYFGPG